MSEVSAFERRFKHPPGLFILFFAEMWERFSYYGMRGLLKLYMVNYLFVTLRQAQQGAGYTQTGEPDTVIGWSLIRSLLPTPDAADLQRCVGEKSASLIAGDAAAGIAPLAADIAQTLATQTCTAGPWASMLYGTYTGLVYMTPVIGGILADRMWGQRKTVFIGGALMAIGHFLMAVESLFFIALLFLIVGNGAFKPNISTQVGNLYPEGDKRRDGAFTIFYMGINLGAFLCNLVCGTLAATMGWHWGFGAAGVGMMLGLGVYAAGQKYLAPEKAPTATKVEVDNRPLDTDEWSRVYALVALCALNIVFWAVYEQQGNTLQSWADEQTVWPTVFGFQIPSTWYQSFNPLCIFLLAPFLDGFWAWQSRKNKEPTSVTKMAIGCFLLGLSFIVMVFGAQAVGTGKGSLFWPLACTLIMTVGELYLSPIGLSLVTKASPARIVSTMMGMWFLSSFFGNFLSGWIGVYYTTMGRESFFLLLTVLGCSAGAAMWAFNKPLKKALAGH